MYVWMYSIMHVCVCMKRKEKSTMRSTSESCRNDT